MTSLKKKKKKNPVIQLRKLKMGCKTGFNQDFKRGALSFHLDVV